MERLLMRNGTYPGPRSVQGWEAGAGDSNAAQNGKRNKYFGLYCHANCILSRIGQIYRGLPRTEAKSPGGPKKTHMP